MWALLEESRRARSCRLTEGEQALTLEDLLKESEDLYGHERNVVEHRTNPRLTRYFYRYGGGRKRQTEIEDTKEWESKDEVVYVKEHLPRPSRKATRSGCRLARA